MGEIKRNTTPDLEVIRAQLSKMGISLDGRRIEIVSERIIGPDGRVTRKRFVHVEKGDETPGPMFELDSLDL